MDALPEDLRPLTRAEGHLIQRELQACSGQELTGWKIAASSIHGQRHANVSGPVAGRLLASGTFPPGSALSLAGTVLRVAEPELAFAFGRDLPPREAAYTTTEVLAAVESLHLAIEAPDSRYRDFTLVGAAQLIAESACAHEVVIGPPVAPAWRTLDLVAHRLRAEVRGRYSREGTGEAVLGDPRTALTWMVNELSGAGETVRAGHVAITGTWVTPLQVQEGDAVRADFGVLGSIEARFTR